MMEQIWKQIVQEAVLRGVADRNAAVPGAKLRKLVEDTAVNHGLAYPPNASPSEKFSDFIGHFEDVILILRRRGRDFLVAPFDQPSLLLESDSSHQTRFRNDVFTAFTSIRKAESGGSPYYDSSIDRFVWLNDANESDPTRFKAIPSNSQENELSDRKDFIEALTVDNSIKESLRETLESKSPLWNFSQALRSKQLAKTWHGFRFQQILRRVQAWAEAEAVEWREHWIVQAGNEATQDQQTNKEQSNRKLQLIELLSNIDESDMQRISIPLDIVLKLL